MTINAGIEQLVGEKLSPSQVQLNQHEKAWRDLRNKLDSMLIGTNVIKGDNIRKRCQQLDSLDLQGRYNHINSNWGRQYAERAMHTLQQLEAVEREISKLKNAR